MLTNNSLGFISCHYEYGLKRVDSTKEIGRAYTRGGGILVILKGDEIRDHCML